MSYPPAHGNEHKKPSNKLHTQGAPGTASTPTAHTILAGLSAGSYHWPVPQAAHLSPAHIFHIEGETTMIFGKYRASTDKAP